MDGIHFDFIITLCDNAADEAEGTKLEKQSAFSQAHKSMDRRIKLFSSRVHAF